MELWFYHTHTHTQECVVYCNVLAAVPTLVDISVTFWQQLVSTSLTADQCSVVAE